MIPRHQRHQRHQNNGRDYVELPPEEKLQLLNEHSMKTGWSSLDEKKNGVCIVIKNFPARQREFTVRTTSCGLSAERPIAAVHRWISQIIHGGIQIIRSRKLTTQQWMSS